MGVGAHLKRGSAILGCAGDIGANLAGRGADAPPVNAQQQVITASTAPPPRLWLWRMIVDRAVFADIP